MRFTDRHGCTPIETMEVKPCPFCGGIPFMYNSKRWPGNVEEAVKGYTVVCVETNCVIYNADNQYYRSPEIAVKWWNKRKG